MDEVEKKNISMRYISTKNDDIHEFSTKELKEFDKKMKEKIYNV